MNVNITILWQLGWSSVSDYSSAIFARFSFHSKLNRIATNINEAPNFLSSFQIMQSGAREELMVLTFVVHAS
jgi:hypothetical protein